MATVTVEERLPSRERGASRERGSSRERGASRGSASSGTLVLRPKATAQAAGSSHTAREVDLLGLEVEAAIPEWQDYLDRCLLPVLSSGVGALLKTVEPRLDGKKGPLDKRAFNPINWLASYLMRHNPRCRDRSPYRPPRGQEEDENDDLKKRSAEWRAKKEAAFKAKYPHGVPRKASVHDTPPKDAAEPPAPPPAAVPEEPAPPDPAAASPKGPLAQTHSMRRLGARARSFLGAAAGEAEVEAAAQKIEDSERRAVEELQNAAEKLKRAEERLLEALSKASAEVEALSREAEMTILRGGITDAEAGQIRQKALQAILAVIVKVLEQRTAGKHAYAALVGGPSRGELRYAAAAGSNMNAPDGKRRPHMEGRVLIRGEGVSWKAVDEGEPLVIPDVTASDPDAQAVHFFGARRAGAFAAYPLRDSGGECIGLLAMDNLGSPGAGNGFSEPDQRLAEALSKAAGVAMDRVLQAERRCAMSMTLQRLQNAAEEIEELAAEGRRPQDGLIIPGFPIAHDTLTSPEKNAELKAVYETVLKAVVEHTGAAAAYALHFPGQGEAPSAGRRSELQCVATAGPDRARVQGRTLVRSASGQHAEATPRLQFAGSDALARAAFDAADGVKTVAASGKAAGPAGAPRDLLEAGAHVAVPMLSVRGEVVGVIGASGSRRLGPGDVAELERLVCGASELADAVARKHGGAVFPQLFSQAVNREAAKAKRRGTGLDADGTEISDLYTTAVDGVMRYTRARGVTVALKNAGRLGAGDGLFRTVAAVGTHGAERRPGDVFPAASLPLADPGPGRVHIPIPDKAGGLTGVLEVDLPEGAGAGGRLDPSETWFLRSVGESLGAAVEDLQQAKRVVEVERVGRLLEEEALAGVGDLDTLYKKALEAITLVTNASNAYLAMMLPEDPTSAADSASEQAGAASAAGDDPSRPASGAQVPGSAGSAGMGLSSFLNTASAGGGLLGPSAFPSFQYVAVQSGHEGARHILGTVLARTIKKDAPGAASPDGEAEDETETMDDAGDYTGGEEADEDELMYEAAETGQPVFRPELRAADAGARAFGMPDVGVKAFGMPDAGSYLAFPLKDEGGNVFAMLGLDTVGSGNRLGAPDLSFITSVSETLANAISIADEKNKVATIAESTLERINEQLGSKVATYFAFQDERSETLRVAALSDPEGVLAPSPRPGDEPAAAPLSARTAAGAPAGPSGLARIAASGGAATPPSGAAGAAAAAAAAAGVPQIQIGDELPQLPDAEGGDRRQFQVAVQDGQGRVVGRIGVDLRRLGRTLTKDEVTRVRRAAGLLSKAMSIVRKKTKNRRYREPIEELTDAEKAPGLREKDRLRLMLSRLEMEQLRQELVQLDPRQVAELRSYENPPKAVRRVVKAALYMLGHTKKELDAWNDARGLLGANFVRRIADFDPTKRSQRIDVTAARRLTTGLTERDIAKHGSVAAQCTLEWVNTAVHLRSEAVEAMRRAASAAAAGGRGGTGSSTARPGLALPRIAEDLQAFSEGGAGEEEEAEEDLGDDD